MLSTLGARSFYASAPTPINFFLGGGQLCILVLFYRYFLQFIIVTVFRYLSQIHVKRF